MDEQDQIKQEEKQVEEGMKKVVPLEELTLKELQKKAEGLGFSDASVFNKKVQVIAVIVNLQNAIAKNIPIVKDNAKKDRDQWKSKSLRMKEKLAAQPKMAIFLPLNAKEKPGRVVVETGSDGKEIIKTSGAVEPVTLNGYRTLVPKGRQVMVPQQVYEVLMESLESMRLAGSDKLIDRSPDVEKALS